MTEIIIFAAIAFGLCAVLYAILGRDIGHSDQQSFLDREFGAPPDRPVVASAEEVSQGLDMSDRAAKGISEIFAVDMSFRPKVFLDGAMAAYAMILEAYADGDREALRPLLTDEVFNAYDAAISAREADGLTQVTDIARIIRADIVDARLEHNDGVIDVRFVAEIASALRNDKDEIVQGDLNMISEVDEVWTFVRNLNSDDPAWALAAVEEEGEDTLGSAPDVSKS